MKKLKKVSDAALAELNQAYWPFNHLQPEEIKGLLKKHMADKRAAKLDAIKTLGVIGALTYEHAAPTYADLERLASALCEIREASTSEGASKRISDPIARHAHSLFQVRHASKSRGGDKRHAAIAKDLDHDGRYLKLDRMERGARHRRVAAKHEVSEVTVRAVGKKLRNPTG